MANTAVKEQRPRRMLFVRLPQDAHGLEWSYPDEETEEEVSAEPQTDTEFFGRIYLGNHLIRGSVPLDADLTPFAGGTETDFDLGIASLPVERHGWPLSSLT